MEYTGTQPLTGNQVAAAEEENKPADIKPNPGTAAKGKPGAGEAGAGEAGEGKAGEAKSGEARTSEAKADKPKAGEEKAEAGGGGKPFDAKGFESKLTSITK